MRARLVIILLLVALPFLGVSCSKNESLDQKARQVGNFFQTNVSEPLVKSIERAQNRVLNFMGDTNQSFVKDLTEREKAAIEEWLIKNKLNQYGDKKDTFYSGGTPLFNEETGQTTNRYEYLFRKFPELKEIIKSVVNQKPEDKR